MGFLKNLKQGIEAAKNPPSQAEIEESLKHLTPEQRAAYDANMARVEAGMAEAKASQEEALAIEDQARILHGPAGDYVYGKGGASMPGPEELANISQTEGALGAVRAVRAEHKGEFKKALRQSFGRDEVEQEKDPAERERIAAEERAVRDEARAPYRAGDPPSIAISRVPTRGKTQVAEVVAYLEQSGLATRPDLVYGLYRVPDRISQALTSHSEKGRVVEWDVVHADVPVTPGGEVAVASFPSREQWVARRVGEPSVLDEDLALAYCARAGIGPESCLGVARYCEFTQPTWGDENQPVHTNVEGVLVFHPDGGGGGEAVVEQMAAEAPAPLGGEEREGTHTDVLNWLEVSRAIHPKIQHAPPVPSPFPYLPSTPQELLRAYLEVVGVRPADCYAAAATVHRVRGLEGQLLMGGTNIGSKQPCADGEDRMRLHGAEHVVIAYRDRPEYADGRTRWASYQAEVLQAYLERGTEVREAVFVDDLSDIQSGFLRTGARVLQTADRIVDVVEGYRKAPPPFRYCWPPID